MNFLFNTTIYILNGYLNAKFVKTKKKNKELQTCNQSDKNLKISQTPEFQFDSFLNMFLDANNVANFC